MMTTRPSIHHRRRHKRFHVPPEAQGVGYQNFVSLPSHGADYALRAEPKPEEEQETAQQSQEQRLGWGSICLLILGWMIFLLWVQHWIPGGFFVSPGQ